MHIKIPVDAEFDASSENILSLKEMVTQIVQESPEAQSFIQQSSTEFSYVSPLGYLTVNNCRDNTHYAIKIYLPSTDEPEEIMHSNTVLYSLLNLPHATLETLWSSIILPQDIKVQLKQLVRASRKLSECNVDPNIVSTHRMLLLHSVPGCGKTSIATALAQELSVDLAVSGDDTAPGIIHNTAILVTVNAHALFSKWFSESGKIITRLFTSIAEEASDGKDIYLLIDEVESLAGNRERAMSAGEPSDMIRAANAMLTQLDHLRRFRNVYTICTTNMLDSLDSAFVDRCDAVIGLSLPNEDARRIIFEGIIAELLNKRVLTSLLTCNTTASPRLFGGDVDISIKNLCPNSAAGQPCTCEACEEYACTHALFCTIVSESSGLSGRQLRKLPYTALSLCEDDEITLSVFLKAYYSLIKTKSKH